MCDVFLHNNGERRATVTTAGEKMVERECGCMQTCTDSICKHRFTHTHTVCNITAIVHHAEENEQREM